MHKLGIDASRPPAAPRLPEPAAAAAAAANGHGAAPEAAAETAAAAPAAKRQRREQYGTKLPTCVVLDIEGTVAPISFVSEVMFPYARAHARSHLEQTYGSSETTEDIQLIRQQVRISVRPEGGVPPLDQRRENGKGRSGDIQLIRQRFRPLIEVRS